MKANTTKYNKQKEDTTVCGVPQMLYARSDIAVSPAQSKSPALKSRKYSLKSSSNTAKSSKTSEVDLISKEKDLRPYWNNACQDLQSQLWLPHKTGCAESAFHSSNGLSNYTEEELSFWKKQIQPKTLTVQPSLPLSHLSSTASTANVQLVEGSRKIRIYPKDKKVIEDIFSLHRRAYNLAIENFRNKTTLPKTQLRAVIREQVREEFLDSNRSFISVVSDEAVNAAYITFQACIKKWKKGIKATLHFKSLKDASQSFIVQKLSNKGAYPTVLSLHYTELLPKEAIGCMSRVTCKNGRYYICVKANITTKKSCEIQADSSVIALDPGVRTFLTGYASSSCIKYADGCSIKNILPLLLKKDKLLSKLDLLPKLDKQWVLDRRRHLTNAINKLANTIEDLIEDLHNRIAYDLVTAFDVIILPTFETSNMVKKGKRKLRRTTVREMLGMSFYKFSLKLAWMCKKYGKHLVRVTEEYTSKTRSWDGVIDTKLGGKKVVSDGTILVDRDINGARGIFLKALTR